MAHIARVGGACRLRGSGCVDVHHTSHAHDPPAPGSSYFRCALVEPGLGWWYQVYPPVLRPGAMCVVWFWGWWWVRGVVCVATPAQRTGAKKQQHPPAPPHPFTTHRIRFEVPLQFAGDVLGLHRVDRVLQVEQGLALGLSHFDHPFVLPLILLPIDRHLVRRDTSGPHLGRKRTCVQGIGRQRERCVRPRRRITCRGRERLEVSEHDSTAARQHDSAGARQHGGTVAREGGDTARGTLAWAASASDATPSE